MIENVQIIREGGKPRFAVLDYRTLKKIEELVEDALDVREAEKVLNDSSTAWKDFEDIKKKFLANPIREKRIEAGLTQKKLASRLGVHQSFITKIERAGYNPSKRTLLRVARVLGCSPSELL